MCTGKWMKKMTNDLGFWLKMLHGWQYTTRFEKQIRHVLAINICLQSQLAINKGWIKTFRNPRNKKIGRLVNIYCFGFVWPTSE